MDLLAVYGSPRPRGNSDAMMDAFIEGALGEGVQVERLYVRKLTMNGCIGCGQSDETGVCVQKDDMEKVYPLLMRCPLLAVATPNYFYHIPGQLKSLVDRSQALFMARKRDLFTPDLSTRRGRKLFDCTVVTMKYFFDAVGVSYGGELCVRGIDEKGAIHHHPEVLARCMEAGKRFAQEVPRHGERW